MLLLSVASLVLHVKPKTKQHRSHSHKHSSSNMENNMSTIQPNLEVLGSSQAEKMLPIRIARTLKGLRGLEDEKENVTSTKYSKVTINLPGVEGTTITTRRNTFHPAESFLTPPKPLERPAITSPRGKKPVDLFYTNALSANISPLVKLQKMRDLAQKRLMETSTKLSPLRDSGALHSLKSLSPVRVSEINSVNDDRASIHSSSISLDKLPVSSPSKRVEILSEVVEPIHDQYTERSQSRASYQSHPTAPRESSEHRQSNVMNPELTTSGPSDAIFTRTFVENLQNEHYGKIEELENILSLKTREIKALNDKLNTSHQDLADLQQNFIVQENKLNVMRDKEGMRDEELEYRVAEVESLRSQLLKLELYKAELKSSLSEIRLELAREVDTVAQLSDEKLRLEENLERMERLKEQNDELLTDLSQQMNESKTKQLQLQGALEEAESSVRLLQRDLDVSNTEISSLKDQLSHLKATLQEKEDSQRLANEKLQDLMNETDHIHKEMALFEKEYKQVEAQLQDKSDMISILEEAAESLKSRVEELEISKFTADKKLSELQSSTELLLQEKQDLLEDNSALRSQHREKDEIIKGDTQKLGELVLEIDTLKRALATKARDDDRKPDYDAQQQINSLKQQIALAQEKTDERIQEVAEQLYHQYSKKHEIKVGQLKKKFEARMEENRDQIESQRRKIENLERLLSAETKDKNHLLVLLEDKDLLRSK